MSPQVGAGGLPRISLRLRVVLIVITATALAMLLFGTIVLAFLRADRIARTDALLEARSGVLIERFDFFQETRTNPFPSDYVVVLVNAAGEFVPPTRESGTRDRVGTPNVRQIESHIADGDVEAPYTVSGAEGATPWRARTILLTGRDGGPAGSITVALPLDADEVVREIARRAALVGLVIASFAALMGFWAANRSLRPLRRVEETAAAIAGGDFAQRIPGGGQNTEVGRLTTALNGMLGQIEAAISKREVSRDRMRQFVADASHELRTPLASIRGFAELYRQGAVPDDEVPATFVRIEGEARRLGRLVEDLLLLARLDEQRPMRRDPVDLPVLVADAAASTQALDPTRAVRVSGPFGGPMPEVTVTGDADRLRQVLSNLAGNAVRHTPIATPIEFTLSQSPGTTAATSGWAVVDVVDHGVGVPDDDKARVFERFTRLDASRTRGSGGGAGLGLSIVAGVVAAHAGRVEVLDTPGGGSTFRVWLPPATASIESGSIESEVGATSSRSAADDVELDLRQ